MNNGIVFLKLQAVCIHKIPAHIGRVHVNIHIAAYVIIGI